MTANCLKTEWGDGLIFHKITYLNSLVQADIIVIFIQILQRTHKLMVP
jgi:hypothetical protein